MDLFLYGVLAYEMLTGEMAFPFLEDIEEHEERIKNCVFFFPDEEGYVEMYKKMNVPLPNSNKN